MRRSAPQHPSHDLRGTHHERCPHVDHRPPGGRPGLTGVVRGEVASDQGHVPRMAGELLDHRRQPDQHEQHPAGSAEQPARWREHERSDECGPEQRQARACDRRRAEHHEQQEREHHDHGVPRARETTERTLGVGQGTWRVGREDDAQPAQCTGGDHGPRRRRAAAHHPERRQCRGAAEEHRPGEERGRSVAKEPIGDRLGVEVRRTRMVPSIMIEHAELLAERQGPAHMEVDQCEVIGERDPRSSRGEHPDEGHHVGGSDGEECHRRTETAESSTRWASPVLRPGLLSHALMVGRSRPHRAWSTVVVQAGRLDSAL